MRYKQSLWRFLAVTVLVAMLAVSISAVSWAFDPDERVLNEEGDWSQKVKAGRYDNKKATSSSALWRIETGDRTASPSDMLEQEVHGQGRVEVEWFRILVDGETARDSDRPDLVMKEGREIPPGRKLRIQMRATFHVDEGGFEPGDYVEWRLGTYPGLALPYEAWEDVMIDGIFFGEACLGYGEDSGVYLRTVFTDHGNEFEKSMIWIEYTYESGFVPVYERTPVDFQFPGWDKSVTAILLPVMKPDPSDPDLTDPEVTETAPSEPEGTEPESTESDAAKPEPSTAPTSSGRPSGGGGGASLDNPVSVVSIQSTVTEESTAQSESEETVVLEYEEVVPGSMPPVPVSEEASEQRSEEDGEPGQPAPANVEISASYSVQGEHKGDGTIRNGGSFTSMIEVANTGETPAANLRIRSILPEHTSFLSASEGGIWGVLGGQERVTWMIDTLEPGESRTMEVSLQVYSCTPMGYQLEQTVYWQAEDTESVNSAKDPENMGGVSGITVE